MLCRIQSTSKNKQYLNKPYSQLLCLRHICSDQADFLNKAQEMASFFERRSYSAQTLKHDLKKMKHLSQSDVLTKSNSTEEKISRIPLILTYHPLNTPVQRILLDNFKVIADDPATRLIFPQPPMFAFRRDENLRRSLVHTTEKLAATRAGTYPCQHPLCRTCGHISSETDLLGPKDPLPIKDSFTCLSSSLIYCISCHRCPAICISETARTQRERFGEHLLVFPVAEHFSFNAHTAASTLVQTLRWEQTEEEAGNASHLSTRDMQATRPQCWFSLHLKFARVCKTQLSNFNAWNRGPTHNEHSTDEGRVCKTQLSNFNAWNRGPTHNEHSTDEGHSP